MAKPLPRKAAAVADRRPGTAASSKTAAARRSAPGRVALPRDLATRLPGPLARRGARVEAWVREVIAELRKVAWPTREEALKLTTVVIAISVVVGLFLGAVDAILATFMHWFLQ